MYTFWRTTAYTIFFALLILVLLNPVIFWKNLLFSLTVKSEIQNTSKLSPDTLTIESLGIETNFSMVKGSAQAGEYGNVLVAPNVAPALLLRIEKGARIVITDRVGNKYTYEVVKSFLAGGSISKWRSQNDYRLRRLTFAIPLTLGLFHWVVIAEIPGDGPPSEDPNAS